MNENLKNYTEQPDAEVWQQINGKMRKGRVRRQAVGAAAGVAIVAASVALMLRPAGPVEQSAQAPAEQPVAMTVVGQQQSAAPDVNVNDVKTEMQVRPQVASVPSQVVEEAPVQQVAQPAAVPAEPVVATVSTPVVRHASSAPTFVPAPVQQSSARPAVQSAAVQPVAEREPVAEAKSGAAGRIKDTILWLPNVFVPGSDDSEINRFRPRLNKPSDYVTNFKMTIFNRSGHQVFHTNDISIGWDGTHNGQALPQAAYVYIIYYTDKDHIQHQDKGTVTLVR